LVSSIVDLPAVNLLQVAGVSAVGRPPNEIPIAATFGVSVHYSASLDESPISSLEEPPPCSPLES